MTTLILFLILFITGFALWMREGYLEGAAFWIVAGFVIAGLV